MKGTITQQLLKMARNKRITEKEQMELFNTGCIEIISALAANPRITKRVRAWIAAVNDPKINRVLARNKG